MNERDRRDRMTPEEYERYYYPDGSPKVTSPADYHDRRPKLVKHAPTLGFWTGLISAIGFAASGNAVGFCALVNATAWLFERSRKTA